MLSGQATVSRTGLTEPAAVRFRDPVFTRDRISTGEKSIVRVLLGGKAVVTARELSVLTINEESLRSAVILGSGKVVPASGGPPPITPTVSVIRGAVDIFALNGEKLTRGAADARLSERSGERAGDRQQRGLAAPAHARGVPRHHCRSGSGPERQHPTKRVPQELRRVIGAREQAKATALIGALSPAAVEGGDTTVTATLVDAGALIGDAVDGVAGAVDRVLFEASGPVLGLGNTVGGTGGVVTSTTDAVLGQGTGDFVGGSGGGGVASGGSGLRSTVGGATGGGLSSGGGSFTGGGLTSGDGGLSGGSLTSGGGGLTGAVGGVTGGVTGVAGGVTSTVGGLLRR
jgi:hypothetical protein